MLAVRLERDVLQQHNLVIAANLLEGAAKVVRGVFPIAARIFLPCACDAPRRVEQALALRVVAGPADQRANGVGNFIGNVERRLGFDEVAVFRITVHAPISRTMSSATAAACSRMSGTA